MTADDKAMRLAALNPGAREARIAFKQFHRFLNSRHLVPEQCYRPSHSTFQVVMWVNQITGMVLSRNYYPLPAFLERALRALNALESARPEAVSAPYRAVVRAYLGQVAYFLNTYDCFGPEAEAYRERIPPELSAMGPQIVPEAVSAQSGEF
ncbi:hypothetical protein ACI2IY_02860 [Lysobacter enzymogenes]|uniref:hypothetical protein n=1 Tax=Lysobacter enzymogenes TaxID=69 RepID=UPI00385159B2